MLLETLRREGLAGTELASAQVGTIRLKLLKIGGRIVRSVRRVVLHLASPFHLECAFQVRGAPVPRPRDQALLAGPDWCALACRLTRSIGVGGRSWGDSRLTHLDPIWEMNHKMEGDLESEALHGIRRDTSVTKEHGPQAAHLRSPGPRDCCPRSKRTETAVTGSAACPKGRLSRQPDGRFPAVPAV